jgi:hypothetical protein
MASIGELINPASKGLEGTSIARIANEIQKKTSQYVGYSGRLLQGMRNMLDAIAVMSLAWENFPYEVKESDEIFIEKLQQMRQVKYQFAMAMCNGAREVAFDLLLQYGFLGPLWRKEGDGYTREQILNIYCASFTGRVGLVENLHDLHPHWKYPTGEELAKVFAPLKEKTT